ncbi:hypothetical protein NL676_013723 [Syzygium grande]|nr:hypothetical protein NL676_013723 [Syzygium grande]
MVKEYFRQAVLQLDILEGDGGVGTVIKLVLVGEVIGNEEEESCVIKSTVEYEVADDASADVSIIPVKPFADIAEVAKKLLTTSAGAN